MVAWVKATSFFFNIKKDWEVAYVDVMGLSGCLLSTWDPLKDFYVSTCILLIGRLIDFFEEINLLNIYKPYHSKEMFWN